jgi:hypothetical protein
LVYQQHTRYFLAHQTEREPRSAFYEDLYDAIEDWFTQGDQLVLGIDANKDVRTGQTLEFARTLGLREVILERHSMVSPLSHLQLKLPVINLFEPYDRFEP